VCVYVIQVVDVDALHAEGLDLDVVDHMKDLSLATGDCAQSQAGKTDAVMAAFEPSAPSTKVQRLVSCSY